MNDGMAKIRLRDGRTVRRVVTVRYRDVNSGKYLPTKEVEALSEISLSSFSDKRQVLEEIIRVQSRLATDPESGTKSTSAGRLVMQILNSIESSEPDFEGQKVWFVLGRDLALEISKMLQSVEGANDSPR